jgi:hypothetical protein
VAPDDFITIIQVAAYHHSSICRPDKVPTLTRVSAMISKFVAPLSMQHVVAADDLSDIGVLFLALFDERGIVEAFVRRERGRDLR